MDKKIKEPFVEFSDAELEYRVASLGLLHPNQMDYNRFILAAKEYKKAVKKLTKYLKDEIKSVDALIDAALAGYTADQTRQAEGDFHD